MVEHDIGPYMARAAVLRCKGGGFGIENVHLSEPRDDEVLIDVVACGLCHADLIVRDQHLPSPLPMVVGHEGAGVVAKVGRDVPDLAVGDHVVMTYLSCGHCDQCATADTAYCAHFFGLNFGGTREDGSVSMLDENGEKIHNRFFGQSSLSTRAIANRRNVVKVGKDLPLKLLGPLGCGLQTGAGAVLEVLKPAIGSSFVVFGAGAVGLSAVMAATNTGASLIIAVDIAANRLALARELGATHVINARETDPVAAILEITGGGAHATLESSGHLPVLKQAIEVLRTRGVCAVVGSPPAGEEGRFAVTDLLMNGRTIRGVCEGDSVPQVFIPKLIDLYQRGRFPFDRLIQYYAFDDIDQAVADAESGKAIKPVVVI